MLRRVAFLRATLLLLQLLLPSSTLTPLFASNVAASTMPHPLSFSSPTTTTAASGMTPTTTYQYDALDRPITVTNGAGQTVGYGYDAVGNVAALTYPDSSVVTRSYDALDRLSSVTDPLGHSTTFGYDGDSNLITATGTARSRRTRWMGAGLATATTGRTG